MAWFTRNVAIEFIDATNGAVFASTKMPVDNLPDTFEVDTTLHLGDCDWSVVHARRTIDKGRFLTNWKANNPTSENRKDGC